MEDRLVLYDTAVFAKEKGFNLKCKRWYNQIKALEPIKGPSGAMCYMNVGYAPTQTGLQKWLREIHKIEVFIRKGYGYEWYIEGTLLGDGTYNSYEDALEIGLQEALKLISL